MSANENRGQAFATRKAFDVSASSIPARFQQIAEQYPNQVAIGSGSWQPTYAELDSASSSLANLVDARRPLQPEGGRVALLQNLDGYLIGSVLGGLKAGRAVCVLNPSDPLPLLRSNLLDVDPEILVCDSSTHEIAEQLASAAKIPVLNVTEAVAADRSGAGASPRISSGPEDIAFLLRTSGTTGRAKWVMQTHLSFLHHIGRHEAVMHVRPNDRLLLLASPSGLLGVSMIFCALLNGAAVCPFPIFQNGMLGLGEWIRKHKVTIFDSAASAFRHFLKTLRPDEHFPLIRLVKLGAEAVRSADLSSARHFPDDCAYYCTYSCAEAGTMMQLRPSAKGQMSSVRLPLGDPAEGVAIALCDESGSPVADGEVGEIIVRSRFLSAGYWRDEHLTAKRFIEDSSDGLRGYKTGDLGRRELDGALYCLGRVDDVIKIRGQRVAIADVQAAIDAIPMVHEAAVLPRSLADGTVRLVAFVVLKRDAAPNVDALRHALAATLPSHAVPTEITLLDRLPLHPHGKVDREALLARHDPQPASQENEQFSTLTEVRLAEIWKAAFDSAGVRRDANFFHLGGDSLTGAVIAAKVRDSFAVDLTMLDFAEHPHLMNLAARIDDLGKDGAAPTLAPIKRAPRPSAGLQYYPLSFSEEPIWRHSQNANLNRAYAVARSFGMRGPLNVDILCEAMTHVSRRNEILRTTFPIVNGKPMQRVHPPEPVELPLVDLSGYSDARERALARLREECSQVLDLQRGPLLRHTLIRIAPDEHWLVRQGHHILYDAWTWKLYFQQLESAYKALLKGIPPPQEAGDLQFGDYSVWEVDLFSPGSKARTALVQWWKSELTDKATRQELPFRRSLWRRRLLPSNARPSDGWLWCRMENDARSRVAELARQTSATHYAVGLAAFTALLAEITGKAQVIIGTHVTTRTGAALENTLGNFSRLMPLCLEYSGSATFLDWLPVVRQKVAAAQAHAQLAREELWNDLRPLGVRPPEIEAIFGGQGLTLPAKFDELDLTVHSHGFKGFESVQPATMPWGFSLNFDLNHEEYQCDVTFDARIHDPAKVRSFVEVFFRSLDGFSASPERPMYQVIRRARGKS